MSGHKKFPTLLEHLPIEIFLQIFGLFPLEHLVASFFGLNSYINSIIQSVRHKNHGIKNNDINSINLLQLFPTLIDRLVIINAETVNMIPLINLRSLSLTDGTQTQLNTIRPQYFPLLEILHIKALHIPSNDDQQIIIDLFQVILSNGFPRLRICTAMDIGTVPFNEKWTGSPNLRILNLKMETNKDDDKLRSKFPYVRQMTNYEHSLIDLNPRPAAGSYRRIYTEIQKLKQLESENKFILDVSPAELLLDSNKPPPRFNNTIMTQRPAQPGLITIQGRVLLQTEPYCRASFLLQITLPQEYPFKCPAIKFLDPIYHPNIETLGRCCGCSCGFTYEADGAFKPTTQLRDIITTIIKLIDSPFTSEQSHNPECLAEYRNDYETFYAKALECTFSYGRPRY